MRTYNGHTGKWEDYQSPYKRCYESHKPLVLGEGIQVYGGSCGSPIITDADVYVGFDLSMKRSDKSFPWEPGESFLYYIPDMHAPSDPGSFIKLVDWLVVQLTAQKKVHLGCIGGHGRTGTVLSALASVMLGEKEAIDYVRQNYCPKAVESEAQVKFLMKHFGVLWASPTKAHHSGSGHTSKKEKHVSDDKKHEQVALQFPPQGKASIGVWGPFLILTK